MLVGGSSGMAAYAARQVAQELAGTPEGDDAVIVVLLPDSGRGYLTKVFNDEWLAQYGFAERPRVGRPDRRRGAARQVRAAARPGAHPPGRDDRRGGRDPAGVQRLPDARGARRAADRGGRGRRLGLGAHPARGAVHRRRPPHRPGRGPHVAPAADHRLHRVRPGRRRPCSRTPTRCSSTRTASRSACSPARTSSPSSPAPDPGLPGGKRGTSGAPASACRRFVPRFLPLASPARSPSSLAQYVSDR